MAKANKEADKLEGIEHALSRTERYIEENQKSLSIIAGAIVAAAAIYFGFNRFYLKPQEEKAQKQMYVAEQYYARDSFRLALHGDGNYHGFLYIIDEYGLTDAAKLSQYYAGICYKNTGKYTEAIDYLKKYSSKAKLVPNIALGSIGDCYAQLGKTDDAIKYYERAANNDKDDFTTPIYLMRAGVLLENKGEYKKALDNYLRVQQEYYSSQEGQKIEKYITRAKIKGNL
jgi:tetratricopeptide (TPR) repeat protein